MGMRVGMGVFVLFAVMVPRTMFMSMLVRMLVVMRMAVVMTVLVRVLMSVRTYPDGVFSR
jgi:hypothetical protein